jgi:serine/threonine-protein kinase
VSPDGRHVAFGVFPRGRREVRRVPLDGGPSLLVTDSLVDNGGVSWGWDGYIYLDAHLEGDGFARVPENGGLPEIVTRPAAGENWHSSPFALPNGKGVLFYIAGPDKIAVVDVTSGQHRALVDGVWGGYATSGHLVWVTRNGILMAQPFDQDSFELSGRAVPLAENLLIPIQFGGANVAISHEGDLAYISGESRTEETSLVWVDRTGGVTELDPDWSRPFRSLSVSPDGSQVAVTIPEGDSDQIWVRTTEGGPPRKLTFEAFNRHPSWLPDGEWVGYGSFQRDVPGVYKRRADGTGGEVLVLARDQARQPVWSPDGEWLVFANGEAVIGQPLGRDGLPEGDPVVLADDGNGVDGWPTVSPDGRWLAFISVQNGEPGVYVRPFPETDRGVWLITESPAGRPVWSRDGGELVFPDSHRRMMSVVSVTAGDTFEHGAPAGLFGVEDFTLGWGYAMDPRSDRFLMLRFGDARAAEEKLVLVRNVFELLRERVGN